MDTSTKQLVELVNQLTLQIKKMQVEVHSELNKLHLSNDIIEAILPYTEDAISSAAPLEEMRTFVEKFITEEYKSTENYSFTNYIKDIVTPIVGEDNFDETVITTDDRSKNIVCRLMRFVKSMSADMFLMQKQLLSINDEMTAISDEQAKFKTSDEYRKEQEAKLEALKEKAASCVDDFEHKKIDKMISTMESLRTYDFLLKRFDELGQKEIDMINTGFFKNQKGRFVMDKFKSKAHMFTLAPNGYNRYLNFEERFLDEKYHPFNNLILFIFMRFVSYADPSNKYDRMYVAAFNSGLSNTVYHRFGSTTAENEFKDVLCKILDHFMDQTDYYNAHNTSAPKNEVRIKFDKEHDAKRRESLTKKLNNLEVEVSDDMTTEEMQELYNQTIDSFVDSMEGSSKESTKIPTVNEDGVKVVEPGLPSKEEASTEE